MTRKLPRYGSDQTEKVFKYIQKQLKGCDELTSCKDLQTTAKRMFSKRFSHHQQNPSQSINHAQIKGLQCSKIGQSEQQTVRNQSAYSLQGKFIHPRRAEHKNSSKKRTFTKPKNHKQLKDVLLHQKVNGLRDLFYAKIRRNNPYSTPVQYEYEPNLYHTNLLDSKGIEQKEGFQKFMSLLHVCNIASSVFIATLSIAFPEINDDIAINILQVIGALIFFAEIVLNFITVRFSFGRKLETLKQIGENYFCNKLGIDCINLLLILIFLITRDNMVEYLRLFTLLKLPDCMQKIEKLQVYFIENYYNEQFWSLFKVFLFNFCFAHLLAIILMTMSKLNPQKNWLITKNIDHTNWYEKYIWSYYWGTTIMLTIGFGDMVPVCYEEAICMIFVETISCMVLAYNISCVGSLITQIRSRDLEKGKNLKIFKKLADKHDISETLSWKINNYIEERTNIKKLFNIEEEAQFAENLPITFRTEYLKQANKKIFHDLLFFGHLMEKTLISLAQKIIMKITHPQESVFTLQTNADVFILKTGELGYISRKCKRKYNKYVFNKLVVEQNGSPFLLNTNFITKKRSNYGIKSVTYSVLYYLDYQNLINTLKQSQLDYQFFCRIRDKCQNKIDQFQVVPCQLCQGQRHTKFACPRLHYMPIEQHILNRYIHKQKVDKNKKTNEIKRNQVPRQSSLVNYLYYNDIYDGKREQSTVDSLRKKYKKQTFIVDQLKSMQNENISREQHHKKQRNSPKSIDIIKFQTTFLQSTSQVIKIQINRAIGYERCEDDVWLLDLDRMKNYKDYFPQNNPCNLVNAFNHEERVKKMMEKSIIDCMVKSFPAGISANRPFKLDEQIIYENEGKANRHTNQEDFQKTN